jgi:hypothetical protein
MNERTVPDSLAAVNVTLMGLTDAVRSVSGDVLVCAGRLDALERKRLSPRMITALAGGAVAVLSAVQIVLVAWSQAATTAAATSQARHESGFVASQVMVANEDRDHRLVTEASKATATLIAEQYERRIAEQRVARDRAVGMRR